MSEIVNLNRARKAKDRAEDKAQAARNRVLHGRGKAERTLTAKQAELAARRLDQAKRED